MCGDGGASLAAVAAAAARPVPLLTKRGGVIQCSIRARCRDSKTRGSGRRKGYSAKALVQSEISSVTLPSPLLPHPNRQKRCTFRGQQLGFWSSYRLPGLRVSAIKSRLARMDQQHPQGVLQAPMRRARRWHRQAGARGGRVAAGSGRPAGRPSTAP